jgi:hypothetical protein
MEYQLAIMTMVKAASLPSRFCNSLTLQNRARQRAVRMKLPRDLFSDMLPPLQLARYFPPPPANCQAQ